MISQTSVRVFWNPQLPDVPDSSRPELGGGSHQLYVHGNDHGGYHGVAATGVCLGLRGVLHLYGCGLWGRGGQSVPWRPVSWPSLRTTGYDSLSTPQPTQTYD